jgi:hypothetical protein
MGARRYLMIRGVALILLLTGAYIVWSRNFSEGLKGVPVLALLSAALSFALDWIDRSQAERLKRYLTHSLLSLPFLITGYITGVVFLTLNAPVIVLNAADAPHSAFRRDHAQLPIRFAHDNRTCQRNGHSIVLSVGRDVVLSFNPCWNSPRLRPAGRDGAKHYQREEHRFHAALPRRASAL